MKKYWRYRFVILQLNLWVFLGEDLSKCSEFPGDVGGPGAVQETNGGDGQGRPVSLSGGDQGSCRLGYGGSVTREEHQVLTEIEVLQKCSICNDNVLGYELDYPEFLPV